MKKIITLAVILSCTLASLAYADGPNGSNGPGQQQVWQNESGHGKGDGNRQQGPGNGPQGNQANAHQDNGNNRGPNRGEQGRSQQHRQDRHEQEHFAWNGHDFRKGQPAPERYRGNAYRINNWNDRGLPAPPQGQHWSYIDGNYVLIAAATGIITSILVNGLLNN